jgi:ABC-type Na+ efflux pump permease subunit
MAKGVSSMVSWIGLAVGGLSIAVAIIMWLLRGRKQSGIRRTALNLLPLMFGLMVCSQAVGMISPSQALWSVLTAVFGFLTLCCSVAIIVGAIDRRQTAGG